MTGPPSLSALGTSFPASRTKPELSGGEGPAAVPDFVGIDAAMRPGLASLARQGLLVLAGLAGASLPVTIFSQASQAAITTSTRRSPATWPR